MTAFCVCWGETGGGPPSQAVPYSADSSWGSRFHGAPHHTCPLDPFLCNVQMGCQTPLSEAAVLPPTHTPLWTLWRGPKRNPDLEPQQMKKDPLSSSWSRPTAEVAKILILVWFCLANKEHAKQLLHACACVYVCVCVPSTHPHTSPDLGGAGRGRLHRDQELIPGLAVWL